LYPRLDAAIEADPELLRRVRVEMYRRLGAYPTETSEHSSEYLDWFLRSPEQIEREDGVESGAPVSSPSRGARHREGDLLGREREPGSRQLKITGSMNR